MERGRLAVRVIRRQPWEPSAIGGREDHGTAAKGAGRGFGEDLVVGKPTESCRTGVFLSEG